MKKYDWLIVGTGLFGSTFARLLLDDEPETRILMIDERNHKGGNLHCEEYDNTGICVHMYGPHIFHTSNTKVWDFAGRFTRFNKYVHTPMARYGKHLFHLPFTMNTFMDLWGVTEPEQARTVIEKQRYTGEVTNLEEQALSLVGRDIYDVLIKGYTEKQWGRECRELPPYIIRRLPLRFTFDSNYFDDTYQGIPETAEGYNELIEGLMKGTDVELGTNYIEKREHYDGIAEHILYTGRIDRFYDYCYGRLEYRGVRHEHEVLDTPNYQGTAMMNYTGTEVPWTRVIEHKHFRFPGSTVYDCPRTVISREYPVESKGDGDAAYPINDGRNMAVYGEYVKLADKEKKVIFGGRLAEYRYFDMDDTIESAMNLYEKWKNMPLYLSEKC